MTVATNPLTYNGYVTQVATLAIVNTQTVSGVVQGVDAAFNILIPQMLNYAELRIQRDLDLLPSQTQNNSYSLTAGNNLLQISVNDFVTLQTVSVTANSTTTPLLSTSKTYIQNVYPDASSAGVPQYFAMYGGDATTYGNTYNNIIVGPWPANTYPIVLTGTQRLQSLYASATTSMAGTATTFISTYLPEMLVQASMIYVSQYQRNFGPASNDPQMGPSYETQYQNLLKGAITEEYRKKFQASAWSSVSSSPVGTPSRSV